MSAAGFGEGVKGSYAHTANIKTSSITFDKDDN
jgi:hypothetical protein